MRKFFIFSLFLVLALSACTKGEGGEVKEITLEEAKVKAVAFINDYLMDAGSEVSIKETAEENGLYKIVVNMPNGTETNSYISRDGETFFPSGLNIEEFKADAEGRGDSQAAAAPPAVDLADITKMEKPKVELFVMSHCPFGTQIEKGILPVLDTLGDSIDFELKFCDYAMHDKKELDEQLAQYCIQENEPEKLNQYLYCFLESEDGESCLDEIGINKSKLKSCVAATDKEFKVTEGYNDKSTWRSGRFPGFDLHAADNTKYGISGSPAFVLNGAKIDRVGRDSATLLQTICAGFENAPEACEAELSSASPSPGFGFSGTGSDAAASCGS